MAKKKRKKYDHYVIIPRQKNFDNPQNIREKFLRGTAFPLWVVNNKSWFIECHTAHV